MIGQDQLDALIAAGGCRCTPDPFRGCDTCGRSARPGSVRGAVAYDFQAETVDGQVLGKREYGSFSSLPTDRICRLRVATDDPRLPVLSLSCDPRKGERLSVFTRHSLQVAIKGTAQKRLSVVVVEIRRLQDDSFTRLYLHPDRGPILSTEDLYF